MNPTKNEIVKDLFLSKNFRDAISKMEPEHLQDDLKSEVILIICELADEKIIGMFQRKELEFFTVRVILNLIKSNTSPFAKQYRRPTSELNSLQDHPIDAIAEIIERAEREDAEDRIILEIDNLYWYKAELVRLYQKHGNYRAIEAETGIPYISCYKNIKQSFEELKQKATRKAV